MEENSPAVIPFSLARKRPKAGNLEDIIAHLLAALQTGMNKIHLQARDVLPDIIGAMHGYMGRTRDWSQPAGYHRAYLYARLHGRKSRRLADFRANSENPACEVLTGLIPFHPGGTTRAGKNQNQGQAEEIP
jgi:hypothetical protein